MKIFAKKYLRVYLHIISSIVLSLLMFYIYLTKNEYYEHTDSIIRDYMFELRGEKPSSGNVVIVDIDEKSLLKYGQWPWSRNIIAKLITNIMNSGAYVVGLDMVFAEADQRSPHTIASQLNMDVSKLPNYDKVLAATFKEYNGLIVGGLFMNNDKAIEDYKDSPNLGSAIYVEHGGQKQIIKFQSTTQNIPILQQSLNSTGFLNTVPDKDGTVRSVPIVMKSTTGIYPSLALEMYKVYLGKSHSGVTVTIDGSDVGVDGINIDNELFIPTDRFARLFINYRGGAKTFEYVSALDVLEMHKESKKLKETFVFLGTSALGLFDMRSTPFDSAMPGVEIHANMLDNFLMNDFIKVSPDAETLVLALIVIIIIVSVLLFTLSHEYLTLPLFIGMLYGLYYLNYQLLFEYHFVINLIIPLLSLLVTFIVTVAIDYILTSSQKKVVMHAFAKKVSPAVMDDLIKHNSEGLLKAVDKDISIFFSDIRSFTSISERLGSPKKVINLLNAYMTPMVEIIIKEKGTVDKFIGDAIMAYWNAPVEVQNHADCAIRSAIKQIEKLHVINVELQKKFGEELKIGIGINSGISTIGEMGSDGRSDYTIIGDSVNLASRLEGLSKNYKAEIIISSFTKDRLVDNYKIRSLDFVKVKGKSKAVEIFEVVVDDKLSFEEIQRYETAITLYRQQNFQEAYDIFQALNRANNSYVYGIYIDRCHYYMENKEVDFDVTLTMTTK